jgi:hypothetical protein
MEAYFQHRMYKKPIPYPGNIVGSATRDQRRCRDMETLFCTFHVGEVGVGVMERGRGCWLGCMHIPTVMHVVVVRA